MNKVAMSVEPSSPTSSANAVSETCRNSQTTNTEADVLSKRAVGQANESQYFQGAAHQTHTHVEDKDNEPKNVNVTSNGYDETQPKSRLSRTNKKRRASNSLASAKASSRGRKRPARLSIGGRSSIRLATRERAALRRKLDALEVERRNAKSKKILEERKERAEMVERLAAGFFADDDVHDIRLATTVVKHAHRIRSRDDPLYRTWKDLVVERQTNVHTGCVECRRAGQKKVDEALSDRIESTNCTGATYRTTVSACVHLPLGSFVIDLTHVDSDDSDGHSQSDKEKSGSEKEE